MQKKLLIFLLLFNAVSLFAQSAYKQNLANLASINFPRKPKSSDTIGYKIIQLVDSNAVYSILYKELDQNKLLFDNAKLPEFYDGVVKGYVGASHGKLISKRLFEIDGLKGIELEMIVPGNPNLHDLVSARMILLNNIMITITFSTSSNNRLNIEAPKTKFFKSLTITADKAAIHQASDSNAYRIGYIIGKYTILAIVLGGLTGAILLIRRLTRKKNSVESI